jgi:hypothetical protein
MASGEEENRSTNNDVDEKIEAVIKDDFMHLSAPLPC